jgi:hypothetical protein
LLLLLLLLLQDFGEGQGSGPKASFTAPKGRITRVFFTDCNRQLITSHDGGWVSSSTVL